MAGKIKVYGKSQNRTALGIIHAYQIMYPHATINDLSKAFPKSLCPDSGVKELFLPVTEAETFNTKMSLYFTKPGEVLDLQDGTKAAMSQVWSKTSLDKLINHARAIGIEVAEPEKSGDYNPAGYRIEYINGWQPAKPKKGCLGILAILIMIGLGTGLAIASTL